MKIKLSDVTLLYINLESETQKRAQIESLAARWRFKEVIRLQATHYPDNFIDACTTSHIEALELAQKIDGPVLIMEDDCVDMDTPIEEIEVADTVDVLYLGNYTVGISKIRGSMLEWESGPMAYDNQEVSDGVYRVVSMYGAHAILHINKEYTRFAERVCRRALELGVPQDVLIAVTMTFYNVYALNSPLFAQSSGLGYTIEKIVK